MTDEQTTDGAAAAPPETTEESPQYGVGPFTIREVALTGVWLVAFVVSFFPASASLLGAAIGGGQSVWTAGLDWVLTIGVPTVATGLVVLRRLSPQGIRRVGSLGIDQFAAVAFSVSAVVWLTWLWQNVAIAIGQGVWIRSWVVWVEFFLALAGVVLTVFAPFIPPFRDDFRGRTETIAHPNARPVRAVVARPARPRPEPVAIAPSQPVAEDPYGAPVPSPYSELGLPGTGAHDTGAHDTGSYGTGSYGTGSYATGAYAGATSAPVPEAWEPQYLRSSADEPAITPAEPVAEPVAQHVHQAFWALAPDERDVHDERGVPIFRIGPTAWALVIEDRGSLFVIRHEDGRIGYLHDVTGVTRG